MTTPRPVRFDWSVHALAVFIVSLLVACGTPRNGPVGAPDVLTTQEIDQYRTAGTPHAYELIQRARPRWLESRGARSLNLETRILVYQNQQMLGGLDVLRDLKLDNIVTIRRLDSARAGLLPGARDQHVEAAIVIETGTRSDSQL